MKNFFMRQETKDQTSSFTSAAWIRKAKENLAPKLQQTSQNEVLLKRSFSVVQNGPSFTTTHNIRALDEKQDAWFWLLEDSHKHENKFHYFRGCDLHPQCVCLLRPREEGGHAFITSSSLSRNTRRSIYFTVVTYITMEGTSSSNYDLCRHYKYINPFLKI